MKKILITGSSGYLGHFLAKHFAAKNIQVVGLDVAPHTVENDFDNFKFIKNDVRKFDQLYEILKKEKPSHVIHLAYLMEPNHDKKFEYDVDVKGSQNIFKAADQTNSVKQFLLFSSTSIYGAHKDNPEWLTEESPLRPADYTYAVHKRTVEEYYHSYSKRPDMKLVIVRMCTAVGPSYYKKGGVVSSLAKAPISIEIGSKQNAVQFIHEDDVKALVEKISEDYEVEDTFNLCPDSYATVKSLAKALKKRSIKIPLFLLKGIFWILWKLHLGDLTPAMAKLMAYSIVASPKKLMDHYNYKFQYTTKEALLDAVEKRKANGTL
ncbi:NAD-dependent epimerase/dehydratase family protein [Patescibacteria group bacterium]